MLTNFSARIIFDFNPTKAEWKRPCRRITTQWLNSINKHLSLTGIPLHNTLDMVQDWTSWKHIICSMASMLFNRHENWLTWDTFQAPDFSEVMCTRLPENQAPFRCDLKTEAPKNPQSLLKILAYACMFLSSQCVWCSYWKGHSFQNFSMPFSLPYYAMWIFSSFPFFLCSKSFRKFI